MVLHLFFLLSLLPLTISELHCPLKNCKIEMLGDYICNLSCNNILCNFDSLVPSEGNSNFEIFMMSDCLSSCLKTKCSIELLKNNECDEVCNNEMCGFDLGLCGVCSSGCTFDELFNEKCDANGFCDTKNCDFDLLECNICVQGCGKQDIAKEKCENEICRDVKCRSVIGNPCSEYCDLNCKHSQVGDGVCDLQCLTDSCNDDESDCQCSPECKLNEQFFNYKCKEPYDPCNNKECGYKNGRCGLCASGCFGHMIGNNICDNECLTEDCEFDYKDCFCSKGCNLYQDGNQFTSRFPNAIDEQSCYVSDCWFNIQNSTDNFIRRSRILSTLISGNFSFFSLKNLPEGCSESDLRLYDSLDGEKCELTSACYSSKALWCMGRSKNTIEKCLRSTNETCVICEGYMHNSECKPDAEKCPSGLIRNTNLTSLFSNSSNFTWCLKSNLGLGNNPQVIYVNSSDPPQVAGDGNLSSPFLSLFQAFAFISYKHTIVKLLPGEFFYVFNKSVKLEDGRSSKNPLIYSKDYFLTIESFDPSRPSVIYWSKTLDFFSGEGLLKISWAGQILIKNVWFSGERILSEDCHLPNQDCFYCPNYRSLTDNSGKLNMVNDKNEIYDFSLYWEVFFQLYKCYYYINDYFFSFDGKATLTNVTFKSFRNKFKYFIKSTSTLTLENVNFLEMQAGHKGVVIESSCLAQCSEVNFEYKNGLVQDLSAGYEINDFIRTGGFLKIQNINSIKLTGIKFSMSVAYSNPKFKFNSALIRVKDFLGTFLIDDCLFQSIYVNSLLDIDTSSLEYEDPKYNGFESEAYSQIHFQLLNSRFENIYSSTSFIRYFTQITHNIRIFNVQFDTIASAGNSIISLIFNGNLKNIDKIGESVLLNGMMTFVKKRTVEFNQVSFNRISAGDFAIFIQKNANIDFKNIKFYNLHDGGREIVKLIIDSYPKIRKYLSIIPRADLIEDLKCTGTIKIFECYRVSLNDIYIEKTSCLSNSTLGIIFENIEGGLNLTSTTFFSIVANSGLGGLLSFNQIDQVKIETLNLSNVSNSAGSLVEFSKSLNISIAYLKVSQVEVNYASPLLVFEFEEFLLIDSFVKNVKNYYGDCGFLKMTASGTTQSTIRIEKFSIEDVKVNGDSGIFLIDSLGGVQGHNIYIQNINFTRVSALYSVFLFITKKLVIYDSFISDVRGSDNFESTSMIFDGHSGGLLQLSNVEFKNNHHIDFPGIIAEYQGSGLQLELKNFQISDITESETVFLLTGKSIQKTSIIFHQVSVKNISSSHETELSKALKISGATLKAYQFEVSFINSFADLNNAGLDVYNGTFHHLRGDFLKSQSFGFFKCFFCKIFENFGNLIKASGGSFVQLSFSEVFSNFNKGSKGTLIEIEKVGNERNFFFFSIIKDNQALESSIFELSSTTLDLVGFEYFNNSASRESFGLRALETDLIVENSTFSHSDKSAGPFIYSGSLGNVSINNSYFFNGFSQKQAGALSVDNCKIFSVSNSIFKNNTSLQQGGAILSRKTFTKVTKSIFSGNKALIGSDLHFSDQESWIINSNFEKTEALSKNQQFSIFTSGNSLKIDKISMKDLEFPVSGLSCINMKSVIINESLFMNISGLDYGAIYFEGGSIKGTVLMKNSRFFNNFSNKSGGAVFLNDMNLEVSDSVIDSNSAALDGGAFYLQVLDCEACGFNITGESVISNNKAERNGGAFRWLNNKPYLGPSVVIFNNSAEYGKDIASVPAFLSVFRRFNEKMNDSQYFLENVPPGQLINDSIFISIYDSYGQRVVTDDYSELELVTNDENLIIMGKKKFLANSGIFNISGFVLRSVPGSVVYLNMTTDSISQTSIKNDEGRYENYLSVEVQLRNCTFGEATEADTCSVCPQDKYLIETENSCKTCPDGGICPGGSVILVKPGFYRTTNISEVLYKCPVKGTCLGSDQDFQTKCLKGYTGITCAACQQGYFKSTNEKCGECPSRTVNNIILFFIVVGFVVFIAVFVKSIIRSAFLRKAKHSIYIKIFTNYLQLLFLVTEFNLSWPEYVVQLFGTQRFLSSAFDVLFSAECSESSEKEDFYEEIYYKKMILYSLLPVFIVIASCFAWGIISWLFKSNRFFFRELPLTIIIVYFIIHLNIAKFMLSNYSCKYFDQIGSYLNQNVAIQCWTQIHKKYSLLVSLPSIIIWSFGIPTAILIKIVKKRKCLYQENNRAIFGFLCNGYKSSIFYWEFIIIYRKIVIICIIVFLAQVSYQVQALCVTIILMFALLLQYRLNPFNSFELNYLELEALITASLTIYCGLYYLTNDIGEEVKLLLFILIVLGNAYFVFTWLYWMCKAIVDIFVKINPKLKYVFSRGDAFSEDFNSEKISIPGTFYDVDDGARKCTFININETMTQNFKIKSMKQLYLLAFVNDLNEPGHPEKKFEEQNIENNGNLISFRENSSVFQQNYYNNSQDSFRRFERLENTFQTSFDDANEKKSELNSHSEFCVKSEQDFQSSPKELKSS